MSGFLLPSDFEVNLPRSPVALGQWLLKNGVSICNQIKTISLLSGFIASNYESCVLIDPC